MLISQNHVVVVHLKFCLFVLRFNVPVNNFFSHVGTLPGYNQYFRGVKCLAQGHNMADPQPLVPESDALLLSHCTPLSLDMP